MNKLKSKQEFSQIFYFPALEKKEPVLEQNDRFIDSHCHLSSILKKLKIPNYQKLLDSEYPQNYEGCITISCDPFSIEATQTMMENKSVYGAFGIHPHDAEAYTNDIENNIIAALSEPKALAWGEMGLDYHYMYSKAEIQRKIFIRQLKQAQKMELPIIIHTREAEQDTLEIMKDHIDSVWPVHVHCFTSSENMAGRLLEQFDKLFLGFTGVLTFPKSENIRTVATVTPLNKILLETDGPFLSPVPKRGRPCHSGYIPYIAEKIAELKGCQLNKVYEHARNNTREMYGI